jgi:hypothetical protein
MSRYLSWLAIAVAAAFLVVDSASPAVGSVTWLAFAISIGTLLVSSSITLTDHGHVVSRVTAGLIAAVSAWTIVASRVFSQSTVGHLALASSLAIAGLAAIGLTAHDIALERAAASGDVTPAERETTLAAAA